MDIPPKGPIAFPLPSTTSSTAPSSKKRTLAGTVKTELHNPRVKCDVVPPAAPGASGALGSVGTAPDSASQLLPLMKQLLIDYQSQDADQMGLAVLNLCRECGGVSMSESACKEVIELIASACDTCTADQIGMIVWGFGIATDIRSMGDAARDCVLSHIGALCRFCSDEFAEKIIEGLGVALGGDRMSRQNRQAALAQIMVLRHDQDPRRMAKMIHGLAVALGGADMPDSVLDEFFKEVVLVPDSLGAEHIIHLMCELTRALGGTLMLQEKLNRLLRQLHIQVMTTSSMRLQSAAEGIGNGLIDPTMHEATCATLLKRVMSDYAACDLEYVKFFIRGLGRALGGRSMTPASCRALLKAILSVHKNVSPAAMREIIEAACEALGAPGITDTCRNELLSQIMALHGSCTPQQMGEMIMGLQSLKKQDLVMDAILRSGASSIEKCLMVAACLVSLGSEIIESQAAKSLDTVLDSIDPLHADGSESIRRHVDAGILAGFNDVAGILTLENLAITKKLMLVDYMFTSLRPLDAKSAKREFDKIVSLDLTPSLKFSALSLLLKAAPRNFKLFHMVRELLIERLADINMPEGVESPEFALWLADMTMLYDSFKLHMTSDFITRQKDEIGDIASVAQTENEAFPNTFGKSIVSILDARQRDLDKARLPKS